MARRAPFEIGGITVAAGRRGEVGLPIARLVTGAEVQLPVLVFHGRNDGPTVWIDAAIHGDEVCGVEIIRRVMETVSPTTLNGTLLAVPIVNVHGFMNGDRYLPDRRDLNRSFPGSARGSLAGRLAHLFMGEVVSRCEIGIDLHSGSDSRMNLPQIRADLDDARTRTLAETFGAPVMIHAQLRDGSLRHAAGAVGATVLLFEGGEAGRFDAATIRAGVEGVLRVLGSIGMLPDDGLEPSTAPPVSEESRRTRWVRAARTGILQLDVELGGHVATGDRLGAVYDSFGRQHGTIRATLDGLVIGASRAPVVNRGDALVHIADVS